MLDLLSVESYPHLKQNKRSDFFNKLKRIAKLGIAKKQTKSVKQLALEAIGRMANG